MNIAEMHVYFRQYAQQMGMQNVRAIVPSQVDVLLNTAISDVVNKIIKENVAVTNDRINTDNSKVSHINALAPLYKVATFDMSPAFDTEMETRLFSFDAQDRNTGKVTTDFERVDGDDAQEIPDYRFIVDFALCYKEVINNMGYTGDNTLTYEDEELVSYGYREPQFDPNGVTTIYYPVRIIDDAHLAETLVDYVIKPRLQSPVITLYNNNTFDLYTCSYKQVTCSDSEYPTRYVMVGNLLPYKLRMSYIANPNEVKYDYENNVNSIDCDLPEYLHVDIVKRAVALYKVSTGSASAYSSPEGVAQQNAQDNTNY